MLTVDLLLSEKLAQLARDMSKEVTYENAIYITERICEIIQQDYDNGLFANYTEEWICKRIEKCFASISRGNIECRNMNVLSIMKCLSDKSYGIYPEVTPR